MLDPSDIEFLRKVCRYSALLTAFSTAASAVLSRVADDPWWETAAFAAFSVIGVKGYFDNQPLNPPRRGWKRTKRGAIPDSHRPARWKFWGRSMKPKFDLALQEIGLFIEFHAFMGLMSS